MAHVLLLWLLALGATLPFLLALSVWLYRQRGVETYFAAWLLTGLGLTNGYLALLHTDSSAGLAYFLPLQPLVIYSVGPCAWLLVRSLLERDFYISCWHLLHFLPALVVAGVFVVQVAAGALPSLHVPVHGEPLFIPFIGGFVLALGYLLRVLYLLHVRYCEDKEASEEQATRRAFLLIVAGGTLVAAVSMASILISTRFSPLLSIFLTTLLLLLLFVMVVRNPTLFNVLRHAIEEAPYKRNQLTDSLAVEIDQRVQTLMEVDHCYRDSHLSLPTLAAAVGVTPHQLSEYLNQHRGMGFARFVNRYRVVEVQSLLLQFPARAVLDIAHQVGFSSKSTFNTAFAEQVGMTPSAWRRSQQADKAQHVS